MTVIKFKGKRKLYRGRYAGLSITYIAKLCGSTRPRTRAALLKYFSHPKNKGLEESPATVGDFIALFREHIHGSRKLRESQAEVVRLRSQLKSVLKTLTNGSSRTQEVQRTYNAMLATIESTDQTHRV